MKRILFALAIVLAAPFAARAQAPALTQSAEYAWRLQVDFTVTPSGEVTAAPVTQFYRSDVTLASGSVVAQPDSVPASLSVDLVAQGAKTVTVAGTSYTYAQALAIVQAVLAQERAAQLAPKS